MLAGENMPFPPLTSASPRLLFDVLPALMSPMDGEKTRSEQRRARFFYFSFINVFHGLPHSAKV